MKTSIRTSILPQTSRIARRTFLQAFISISLTAALATTALAGEDTFRHKYVMRGQVLEVEGNSLVVCVGKNDGAEPGQVLEVVRHVRVHKHKDSAGQFRRTDIGKVRITSLFDDHYANAEVVEGKPQTSDTVELQAP